MFWVYFKLIYSFSYTTYILSRLNYVWLSSKSILYIKVDETRYTTSYKIGNNDLITILGSENLNSMMFTTNYCSNPTVNVPVGSITHLESPWTLNITPILFTVSRDLILGLKNQNYHNPGGFYSWIPPRSSSDRIRIHWIMIYMYEMHQFFDETYPSYVPFIPYYHTW